ncbi:uncharacterized protein G2W53_024218 [Senna tora]|uniref:Uncharacterized protein n=1 Tax=Senna tora TaxID=362788 RepID=A0A834WF94_9FABA|nr:uncharacterized protein G2W53_024218 [Senna tora]
MAAMWIMTLSSEARSGPQRR